ncbi:MAG TPA: WxcM-like domain-containing protein [Nitrosopumilaceae archaeon]|nr:WxcM-like domain-containing protein [Nitrosopumilaceae archaeon]
MGKGTISSVNLEKHTTKDTNDQHVNGTLTVVWRDWDNIIKNHPKMVYVSSVNPGEIKGPHLHTKRNSYFVCIHGKVVFIVRDKNGKYNEIESSDDNPVLIHVPKNCSSAHLNISSEISRVLALADIAWKPNDNEMKNVTFDDYDWSKWKK